MKTMKQFLLVFVSLMAFNLSSNVVCNALGFGSYVDTFQLVIAALLALYAFKWVLIRSFLGNFECSPAEMKDHLGSCADRMIELTNELESLQFECIGDRLLVRKKPDMQIFHRLFFHSQQKCYAGIDVLITKEGMQSNSLTFSVDSVLSGGWTLSSISRKPAWLRWTLRQHKAAWFYLPASPEDVMQAHITKRDMLKKQHGLRIAEDLSEAEYFTLALGEVSNTGARLKKKSMLLLLPQYILFMLRPHNEWDGG